MGFLSQRVGELISHIPPEKTGKRSVKGGKDGGIFRAGRKGGAIEFLEHREYNKGDDLRNIDWKLYGRREKLFIKEREAEVKINLYFLIDMSASMNFSWRGVSKLKESLTFAFVFIHHFLRGRNVEYLIPLKEDSLHPVKIDSENYYRWIETAEKWEGEGERGLSLISTNPLPLKGPGFIFVFSDWLEEENDKVFNFLGSLVQFSIQPISVMVLHPLEVDISINERVHLVSLEDGDSLDITPYLFRKVYKKEAERYFNKLEEEALKSGIPFFSHIVGGDPLPAILEVINWIWSF